MKSQHAFTLLEALISLSIIIIIAAISLPSLRDFFVRSHDEVLQRQLMQAIQLAQQEARSRYVAVAICKSNNGLTCSGDWSDGLLVFADDYDDGVVHDKSQILSVIQVKANLGQLNWRSFPYYFNYLQFQANGLMRNNNGTFWYCHEHESSPVWAILLSKSGRMRVVYADQHGKLDMGQSQPLLCASR